MKKIDFDMEQTDTEKKGELADLAFVPDCVYPSDNDWEIPLLDIDMQSEPGRVEIPFVCFGEQRRTFKMNGNGTLHFYTDDYRFTRVFEHPEQIINHHPAVIVEPNYSLFVETPLAYGMYLIYKKRWIARTLQRHGIRVLVDLNVAPKWYKANLIGVPKGWRAFCTRGYSDRMMHLDYELDIARMVAGTTDVLFVVYGGGEEVKQWCKRHKAVYVTPVVHIKNKDKKLFYGKVTESVALLRPETETNMLSAITARQTFNYLDGSGDGSDALQSLEED